MAAMVVAVHLELQLRDKSRSARRAQRILTKALACVADRADDAGIPRSVWPPNGSMTSPSASAIALMVKSRRERSGSSSPTKVTLAARVLGVLLGAKRRDLHDVPPSVERHRAGLLADKVRFPAPQPAPSSWSGSSGGLPEVEVRRRPGRERRAPSRPRGRRARRRRDGGETPHAHPCYSGGVLSLLGHAAIVGRHCRRERSAEMSREPGTAAYTPTCRSSCWEGSPSKGRERLHRLVSA